MIRHVGDLDVAERRHHLGEHAGKGLRPFGAHGEFVRLRTREREGVGERLDVGRRTGSNQERADADHRHRGEILFRVVRQGFEGVGIGDNRCGRAVVEGVAIGRRLGRRLRTDHVLPAGTVLDHHRLAQCLGQLFAGVAGDHVRAGASRLREDPFDRLVRPGLGVGGMHRQCSNNTEQQGGKQFFHQGLR